MQRPKESVDGFSGVPYEEGILKETPQVFRFLVDDAYDDGTRRERATITLFYEGPRCKVCLNDRDTHRVVFHTGAYPEEALKGLDQTLADGTADWRAVTGPQGKRR